MLMADICRRHSLLEFSSTGQTLPSECNPPFLDRHVLNIVALLISVGFLVVVVVLFVVVVVVVVFVVIVVTVIVFVVVIVFDIVIVSVIFMIFLHQSSLSV